MAINRSPKSPFKSAYAERSSPWVSAAQYLAEEMCVRCAHRQGKTLVARFWQKPEWKKLFLMQVRFANGLLKIYSVKAILLALRSTVGKKVYSLGAKWFDDTIKAFERKLKNMKKEHQKEIEKISEKVEQVRPAFDTGNDLNKLRDL